MLDGCLTDWGAASVARNRGDEVAPAARDSEMGVTAGPRCYEDMLSFFMPRGGRLRSGSGVLRPAVDMVVHDDVQQSNIAANRWTKWLTPITKPSPSPPVHQYSQFVLAASYRWATARSHGHAGVCRPYVVSNDSGEIRRTSDADDGPPHCEFGSAVSTRLFERPREHAEIAAAGAPVRITLL